MYTLTIVTEACTIEADYGTLADAISCVCDEYGCDCALDIVRDVLGIGNYIGILECGAVVTLTRLRH